MAGANERIGKRPAGSGLDDWGPIELACAKLIDRFPAISGPVAASIVEEIEEYRDTPIEEVTRSLALIGGWALSGLAQRRAPTETELQLAFDWGRRRAREGVGLDPVMRSFRVGFREWLTHLFPLVPARHRNMMLEAMTVMWQWLDDISRAVTRGFAAESSSLFAQSAKAREGLIEALRNGDIASDETRTFCEALGFDPIGPFRAVWARGTPDADVLATALTELHGTAHAIIHGLDVIVVSQGVDVASLERLPTTGAVGVGLERAGLAGARASLTDAKLCLALSEATGESPLRFDTDWLRATLHADRVRLAPVLERGIDACRKAPHIAAAALTFTSAGFSQSETARRLHLQPNSLNYRLRRWEEMTGKSLRDPVGVAFTLLAAVLRDESSGLPIGSSGR